MSEEQKPEDRKGPDPDPERTEEMGEPAGRDWSSFEGDIERRVRDARRAAHEQAREAERMARESERMAREAERMARDTERAAHETMRERMREARDRDREARREERQARREEWRGRRHVHIETDIPGAPGFGFDAGDFAKKFMKDFVSDATGDSYSETVNGEFLFDRMPRLRIRNVSGETRIKIGDAGKITVVAKKQVTAGSEDRAKRLLQNLEIRMEKSGDELRIEPHLYEQERSWVDLFRGKRFRVDFDIIVPQECGLDAQTVSGDVVASGIRGPMDVQSVSGEITLEDTQGPLRLKSVSGDVAVRRYVGHVEGNTVSGDISFDAARIRSTQLHTVSGDVDLKGILEAARDHRFRTISGDIEMSLVSPDLLVDFRTASGDLESDIPSNVNRHNRKEFSVALGDARGHAIVKTVSGDLSIRATNIDVPGEPTTEEPAGVRAAMRGSDEPDAEADGGEVTDVERTEPMDPEARERVRGLLEKLAKGEIGVDDAASALDEARRSAPGGSSPLDR
jgi:putative adhesin